MELLLINGKPGMICIGLRTQITTILSGWRGKKKSKCCKGFTLQHPLEIEKLPQDRTQILVLRAMHMDMIKTE